jgi:hypothetical protein
MRYECKRRVPLMEQKLLTISEHQKSPLVFSGVRVTQYLALCVMFVDRCLFFCLFLLAIVLFVLPFTNYEYPFDIFKHTLLQVKPV